MADENPFAAAQSIFRAAKKDNEELHARITAEKFAAVMERAELEAAEPRPWNVWVDG